jgi:hypothetical protein
MIVITVTTIADTGRAMLPTHRPERTRLVTAHLHGSGGGEHIHSLLTLVLDRIRHLVDLSHHVLQHRVRLSQVAHNRQGA